MIISRSTEYALRIASFLALCDNKTHFSSKQVSKATNVPAHYCSKILRKLVNSTILLAVRGKGGGFVLGRSPAKINFTDIFNSVDVDLNPKHCVFGQKECGNKAPCLLHYRWKEFNEQFQSWADKTTLADIIDDVNNKTLLGKYRR